MVISSNPCIDCHLQSKKKSEMERNSCLLMLFLASIVSLSEILILELDTSYISHPIFFFLVML